MTAAARRPNMSTCCSCYGPKQSRTSSCDIAAAADFQQTEQESPIQVVVDGDQKTDSTKHQHDLLVHRCPLSKLTSFTPSERFVDNRSNTMFSASEIYSSGSIKFKGMDRAYLKHTRSKYMALCSSANVDAVVMAMERRWKLQFPKLLICILGGESVTPAYKVIEKSFRKSLVEAILRTDVWLFTGGLNCGLMKSIGQALTSYAIGRALVKKRNVVAIGMAPLGVVKQKDKLLRSERKLVEYDLPRGEEAEESSGRPQGGEEGATPAHHLEPNHTHFILVGDENSKAGDEVELRTELVNEIAKSKITGSRDDVPVVYLVFGGDESTIGTVHDAVCRKKTPVLIVPDSGGAADILSEAMDYAQCATRTDFEIDIKITQLLTTKLQLDLQEHIRIKGQLKEIVKRRQLMNMYRHEDGVEEAILGALMKANHGCKDRDDLHLAVIWNRIDLARKCLLDYPNWKDDELGNLLFDALVNNQRKFVKLFLDEGRIDPKKFLTVRLLAKLYEKVCKPSPLYTLLDKQKEKRMKKDYTQTANLTMMDIGNVQKELIFEIYKPMYDSDDTYDDKDHNYFVDPFRELFLWSILFHRYKLARLFWKRGKTSIGGALVGCKLLRALSEFHTIDQQESARMLDHSKDFERMAIELLSHCFAEDRRRTSLMLVQELQSWGGSTCLELATAARSKCFIAHAAVQNLLNELWMGRLSYNTSLIQIWACLLCPLAVPFAVTYIHRMDHSVSAYQTSADDETTDSIGGGLSPEVKNSKSGKYYMDNSYMHYSVENDDEVDYCRSIHTYMLHRERTSVSLCYRFKLFIDAPIISFHLNMISYFIFLGLFSYILLANLHEEINMYEMVLVVWVFTLFTEEVRQLLHESNRTLYRQLLTWFLGYWNCIDLVSLVLFAVGFGLRLHRLTLGAARIVWALDLIVFYLRILHILSASKILGPKLIMIMKMLVDLVTFLAILLVFMVAYGVACQSILFPNTTDMSKITKGVLYQSYFQLYGELFLDDINKEGCAPRNAGVSSDVSDASCPQHAWFGEIVLAVYLFISNVLLLNLLIAMLNYTFHAIQENTDKFWKFQRYELVKEYYQRPSVVPPFIIVVHIYQVVRWAWNKCCPTCAISRAPNLMKNTLPQEKQTEISIWEEVKGEDYLMTKKQNHEDLIKRMKLSEEKLEAVSAKMSKFVDGGQLNKNIEGQFNKLSAQMRQLLASHSLLEEEEDNVTHHQQFLRHRFPTYQK